jgi:hypothetical protein
VLEALIAIPEIAAGSLVADRWCESVVETLATARTIETGVNDLVGSRLRDSVELVRDVVTPQQAQSVRDAASSISWTSHRSSIEVLLEKLGAGEPPIDVDWVVSRLQTNPSGAKYAALSWIQDKKLSGDELFRIVAAMVRAVDWKTISANLKSAIARQSEPEQTKFMSAVIKSNWSASERRRVVALGEQAAVRASKHVLAQIKSQPERRKLLESLPAVWSSSEALDAAVQDVLIPVARSGRGDVDRALTWLRGLRTPISAQAHSKLVSAKRYASGRKRKSAWEKVVASLAIAA